MAAAVSASSSPSRTPSTRAPMFSPSFTTRRSLLIGVCLSDMQRVVGCVHAGCNRLYTDDYTDASAMRIRPPNGPTERPRSRLSHLGKTAGPSAPVRLCHHVCRLGTRCDQAEEK